MNKGLFLAAVAAACLNAQEIWDARCEVGCRREGYDSGKFVAPDGCACFDTYSAEAITKKRVVLGSARPIRKTKPAESKKTSSPYSSSW